MTSQKMPTRNISSYLKIVRVENKDKPDPNFKSQCMDNNQLKETLQVILTFFVDTSTSSVDAWHIQTPPKSLGRSFHFPAYKLSLQEAGNAFDSLSQVQSKVLIDRVEEERVATTWLFSRRLRLAPASPLSTEIGAAALSLLLSYNWISGLWAVI